MRSFKELLDAINTDGGHILLAIVLLFAGIICLMYWKMVEGKDLFMVAVGWLGRAMNSTGKAAGSSNDGKGGPDGTN